ncbi:MAG: DUF333 domain-containing protein [Oligoflexia bacterium]|nr:DUF333 domain-containing protein [Oligoflexia bacterium]
MKKKSKTLSQTLMLTLLLSIFSIFSFGISAKAWSGVSSSLVPNPASEFCDKVAKGEVLIYQSLNDNSGETGYCKIGDALIEEWSLFYATDGGEKSKAIDFYFNPKPLALPHSINNMSMPNPASYYCHQLGGDLVLVSDKNDGPLGGGQIGVCRFDDRSMMEEWTLFRAYNHPSNKNFTDFLKSYHWPKI